MNHLSGFLNREKDRLLIVQRNIWIKFKRLFKRFEDNQHWRANPDRPKTAYVGAKRAGGGKEVSILKYFSRS